MTNKEKEIKLPNGSVLKPGGRVRVPTKTFNDIDPAVFRIKGVFLDERAASPYSEVICWYP